MVSAVDRWIAAYRIDAMSIADRLGIAVSDAQLRARVHRCGLVRIWLTPEDGVPLAAVSGWSRSNALSRRLRYAGLPITICAGGVSRVVLEDGYVVRV